MKLINKIFLSIGLVAGSTAFVSCDLTTETQSSFDESVVSPIILLPSLMYSEYIMLLESRIPLEDVTSHIMV